MNEYDVSWSRAETAYKGQKLRRSIAGSRERRMLKRRRQQPGSTDVS